MLLSLRFLTKEFLLTFLLPGLNFDVTKSMFSLEVKFFIFIVLFQTVLDVLKDVAVDLTFDWILHYNGKLFCIDPSVDTVSL